MRLEVETGLTIIVFPKLAEAAGNARGVPNGGGRSRSAISGKMCISPRCMIHVWVVHRTLPWGPMGLKRHCDKTGYLQKVARDGPSILFL